MPGTPGRSGEEVRVGVETAIIAAAGAGTRMWPATKVVPKELFPVGRLPAIAWQLAEFHAAGIRRVAVVANADNKPLIEALVDPRQGPPASQAAVPAARRFQAMLEELDVTVVLQHGPYGNGTPLLNAVEAVGRGPCIYAFGDDIVLGRNCTAALLDVHARTGGPVLAVQPVARERVGAFGIVETRPDPEAGAPRVTRLVEKPAPGETDSNLAAFGRYLVTPEIIDILEGVGRGKGGEVWFVDAVIRWMAGGGAVHAWPLDGAEWVTVGDAAGYARAVARAAELGDVPG